MSGREEVTSHKQTGIWEYSCGRSRAEGRGGRAGRGRTYTCRCEMSCPTVISSATFWYRLWLFKTMLSRMARDLCRMDTSTMGWLTYPAI